MRYHSSLKCHRSNKVHWNSSNCSSTAMFIQATFLIVWWTHRSRPNSCPAVRPQLKAGLLQSGNARELAQCHITVNGHPPPPLIPALATRSRGVRRPFRPGSAVGSRSDHDSLKHILRFYVHQCRMSSDRPMSIVIRFLPSASKIRSKVRHKPCV